MKAAATARVNLVETTSFSSVRTSEGCFYLWIMNIGFQTPDWVSWGFLSGSLNLETSVDTQKSDDMISIIFDCFSIPTH